MAAIGRLTRAIALVGFFGLLVLSLMTVLDILMRWLFSAPLHGVNDVAALVMALVISAGFPASFAERQHIGVDFVGKALGPRGHRLLDTFGNLVTLAFILGMAWRFALYAIEIGASGQKTWVLAIPVAPFWWGATLFLALCVPVQLLVLANRLRPADA